MQKPGTAVLLINKDGHFYLSERIRDGEPNLWETAGGKIAEGETPEKTIIREAKEEANVDLNSGNLIALSDQPHMFGNGVYSYLYIAYIGNDEPQRMEPNKSLGWQLFGSFESVPKNQFVDYASVYTPQIIQEFHKTQKNKPTIKNASQSKP